MVIPPVMLTRRVGNGSHTIVNPLNSPRKKQKEYKAPWKKLLHDIVPRESVTGQERYLHKKHHFLPTLVEISSHKPTTRLLIQKYIDLKMQVLCIGQWRTLEPLLLNLFCLPRGKYIGPSGAPEHSMQAGVGQSLPNQQMRLPDGGQESVHPGNSGDPVSLRGVAANEIRVSDQQHVSSMQRNTSRG